MRGLQCVLIVTVLLAGGLPGPLAAAGGSGSAASDDGARPPATPDGWFNWSADFRLTDNGAEDRDPMPAVEPNGHCGIAWSRAGDMMWMKVDKSGTRQVAEKILVGGGFPVQESGFVSPCIAADSKGSYHIVAESGGAGAYYAKFDRNGDPVVSLKAVSPTAVSPDNPSIAVAPGGNISVVYEDNRWGYSAQAIACTILDINGTVMKDAIRMSGESMYCEGSTVAVDRGGNIHAAIRNTATGIYHVKLDPNGNALPEAPPTYLYRPGGSFYTDGPPAIACDGTGAVHVVWNDNPRIGGILRYMKLDNDGIKLATGPDGLGIPLTLGATCKGFPSIVADQSGCAYVFWSDTRDGRPQIRRMMLQPRYLNDTDLPYNTLRLDEDEDGNQLEPKAAQDRGGNVFVAWRDNRDGNYEIFYKFGYKYGVNLTMNGVEMQKLSKIHPNHARSGNVTLTNMGGDDDVAELGLEVDFRGHPGGTGTNYTGRGWHVWFSPPGPIMKMGYLETRNVTLNVEGPATGIANDYICVTANCTSYSNSAANSRVSFKAYLVMNHSLEHMQIVDKVHTTGAGEPTTFSLYIQNGGVWDEGIDLSVEGPPGWDRGLSAEHVHLWPHEGKNLTLEVTPPLDAFGEEVGIVTVTARFAEEPTVYKLVKVQVIASPVTELSIRPDRANDTVAPGKSTSYVITVSMDGNIRWPAPVLVEASWVKEGWNVSLDATAVSLAANESASVVLSVLAPKSALAGDELAVNVSCRNESGAATASCVVTTTVLQMHGFDIAVAPANAAIGPGGSAVFVINITNTGNGPERFWPENISGPAGWAVTLRGTRPEADVGTEGIPVAAGSTGWFEATVASPLNASTGEYRFTGRVRDGAGNILLLEFTVSVDQVFGVELRSAEPDQHGETGARVIFPLSLRNAGNGPDVLRLNASALPDGWAAAEFRDSGNVVGDRLGLNASATGQMAVAVVIPRSTPLDEVRFKVTAASSGGPNVTIELAISIWKADLVISGVTVRSLNPRVGKPVFVNVTVKNTGDTAAANVTVAFFFNLAPRTNEDLGPMNAGENRTVAFIWVPVEGDNLLQFAVDPKDEVCERNETDNEVEIEKRVYMERVSILSDDSWMILAAAIPAIAIGLILATYTAWRRRPRL